MRPQRELELYDTAVSPHSQKKRPRLFLRRLL